MDLDRWPMQPRHLKARKSNALDNCFSFLTTSRQLFMMTLYVLRMKYDFGKKKKIYDFSIFVVANCFLTVTEYIFSFGVLEWPKNIQTVYSIIHIINFK